MIKKKNALKSCMLLIFICFILGACGSHPVKDTSYISEPYSSEAASFIPIYSTGESAIQTMEESTPSSAASESSTPEVGENTTQTSGESEAALTTDFFNLEYQEERIEFSEQKNDFEYFSVARKMRTVTVNGRKYCFELSIPKADCTERIRFTEELLINAGITREFRICLYSIVKHTYIADGSLYGRMSAMSDLEYMTAVLIAAYGEFANYGMAYGYAGLLLGKEIPEAKYPVGWNYYDLNYLCFLPQFSSEEDAENAKAIALDFAAEYVAQKGHAAYHNLLEESGKAEEANAAREALLHHYKTRGVSPVLSPVLYAMGGQSYDYIVRCEYAFIYMGKDCAVRREEGWLNYPETYLHEDYPTVAYVFESLREEMHLYQSFLNLYPYNNELKAFFVENIRNNRTGPDGYYDGVKHQIYMTHLYIFSEEYIHSITRHSLGEDPSFWQIEGIVNYLVNRYSRFFNEDYNALLSLERHPEMIEKPVGQYYKLLKRPYDSALDWHDYSSWITYFKDSYDIDKLRSYEGAISFMTYLCRRFGEREVLDYLFDHHDLKRLSEESLEELTRAWKESLEERFKDYKKAGEAGE